MSEVIDKLKKAAHDKIDVPGFMGAALDDAVMPALKAAAEKTSTKLDDMALAAMGPILADELKAAVKGLWGKLWGQVPE